MITKVHSLLNLDSVLLLLLLLLLAFRLLQTNQTVILHFPCPIYIHDIGVKSRVLAVRRIETFMTAFMPDTTHEVASPVCVLNASLRVYSTYCTQQLSSINVQDYLGMLCIG
ncbi:hypothetical protein BD289DRAFT_4809 [Coniella lustricola]|uniref:Uncharacterized protein n=1 Tax=Coniella lustricola TaxID=2025994 RepID=A0A2T3ANQ4_9PEZI|nr:hypothetical protein BD289DRAFT_4809 [Coniella lustricola]